MSSEERPGGIAPPQDARVPTAGLEHRSRERDEERPTRKPLALWDRVKLLLLLVGAFGLLYWATYVQFEPLISARDAFRQTLRSYWWLLALAALEFVRQVHYLISEHSAGYHHFWTKSFFGGFERRTHRLSDWTRFRLARVFRILFVLFVLDLVLAKLFDVSPVVAWAKAPIALFQALPFIAQIAFAFFFVILQFVGLFWFLSRGGVDVYMPDDIKARFTDVKGQDPVLERVKENMIFLEDPDAIERRGGYVPGGVLLWGPPGTGKTLMAQAIAGETSRPFVFVEPGAFINMFVGVGILKVKALYRKVRRLALRYGGVIVFFDEADSLGNRGSAGGGPWNEQTTPWSTQPSCNGMAYLSRPTAAFLFQTALPARVESGEQRGKHGIIAGLGAGGGGMGTLQSLLSEMDGLKKPRGFVNRTVRRILGLRPKPPPKYRILHMFATNRPDVLDEAMLRPGRIDRIYKVGYPSKDGRKETFDLYLSKVKHELTNDQVDKLATITPYATGASIKDMVNEALVVAIRDGRESITWADMIKAKHLKEYGPPDDFTYVERERHAVAVHEACHAVVAYRVQRHLAIDVATIERRGDVGGFVRPIPLEDLFTEWKTDQEADIMVSLASLAGERFFFDEDNSSGVAGDLRSATAVAARMEAYLGMGSTVGSHAVTKLAAARVQPYVIEDGQDRMLLETELGRRVESKLQDLLERTRRTLKENRQHVLNVAHALETHKTVSGDDVVAIIEGTQGPLVDGRPYHDRDFIGAVENYHSGALEAHKDHAAVPVTLPELASGNGDRRALEPATSRNGELASKLARTDLDVLARLSRSGADMGRPRLVHHYLYFPSELAAREVGELLTREGFTVNVRHTGGDGRWVTQASHEAVVSEDSVREQRVRMTELAETRGGDYDGWEAEATP